MSTATRRGIYGKLAGDTTLNALLGSPPSGYHKSIYFEVAPQGASFPFVTFSKSSGVPTDAMHTPGALDTETWLIKAVDRAQSADTAEAIAARIQALLNDTSMSLAGALLLYLRRQSDIEYPEVVDGDLHYHVGSLYRLVTQPN